MRQQLNKRNPKSHGAQYKISIPKFDFKQAAIEEKMVDEVLQGDYDYQESPFKKQNKRLIESKESAQTQQPKLQPLINRSASVLQQESLQEEEKQMAQDEWVKSRLELQKVMNAEQEQLVIDDKVYSYEEDDVLAPIGDKAFLSESLESNKNLTNYDCFNEKTTGSEWIGKYKSQSGPHGKSPVYIDGQYQWVDIQLVSYNASTDRYLIKTMSGMQKEVNRLSILFKDEDMDKFRSRLKICKMRQQVAEDDTRFQTYIKNQDVQEVSAISMKVKKSILGKALKRRKVEQMNIIVQDLVTDLVAQVETEYQCFMKKVVVIREMQDNNNDQKFHKLRLRVRRRQNTIPIIGIISIKGEKQFGFKEMREQVARLHISNKKQVVETMNMFTNKGYHFEHFPIFKTSLTRHQLPLDLASFDKQQQNYFKTARQQLQYQWREDLISDINKKLDGQHFNFYEIDLNKYLKSDLCRLLKRYDLMMNTYVRNFLVTNNVQDWCSFVQKFTVPDYETDEMWQINDYPLLSINLEVNTKLQDKIKFMKRKKTKKLEDQNKQMQEQAMYDAIPDEIIYFEPNYQKVLETLQKPFKNLILATNSFNNMEKDLLSLLDIPERQTYVINENQPEVMEGMERIKSYLDKGYKQAQDIMDKFKKYQFLFERTEKTLIKNIFGSAKEIVIEDLDRDLVAQSLIEIAQAKSAISKLCINQFNGRFFQVNTQKAKQNLLQKADEQLQIILNKLSEICFNNVELIGKTYEEMIVQITQTPTDEHQLMALKNFINENDLNLGKIDKKVVKVAQFLDCMDDYCFPFDEKNLQSFWFLKSMPAEIKSAVMDGQKKAANQDQKFREKLKKEQDAFQEEMVHLTTEVENIKKFNDYTKIKECAEKMMITKEKLEKAQSTVQNFNERERLFKMDVGEYDDLAVLVNTFEPFQKIWDLCQLIDYEKGGWMTQPFLKLNYADIEKKINTSYIECSKLIKVFEELDQNNAVKISRELIEDISEFKQKMWVIELLTTEAMVKKPAYWKEVFNQCKLNIDTVNDEMSFIKLIDGGALEHRGIIEELSKKADKQWGMEKKLLDIIDKLKEIKLELFSYKATYTLKGIDELQQTIDDYLNVIGMMKQSSFIKPVQKECNKCDGRLQLMQDTLDGWIKCQRNWMYLQPIFASEDIKKKMPLEKQKFDSVDKNWRGTMDQFFKEGGLGLYDSMETDKLKNEFDQNNRNLDQIQKQLSQYMETKRRAFARFYFLSDDQLLEILADTKDPTKVQNHMSKCFEAIKYVEFKEGNVEVAGMISPEEEIVHFSNTVHVEEGEKKGNVEIWLLEIEDQMRKTLRDITKTSLIQYQKIERTQWVLNWQAQVIIAVNMIKWTHQTEDAILGSRQDAKSLKNHYNFLDEQLSKIVNLVRGDLKVLDRMTLGALVTLDVHAKDIIDPLINENVTTCQDFKWTSQLRYYYDEPTKGVHKDMVEIKVQIVNATQFYGFEYLGNSTRLVITPLTDRCYTTLMGAYHLNYGGAPEGPAGTGKTETTKDLAKAVAMYCMVYNCSDGLNFQAMSKFFKGLVSSGSWCCFDEFNRINVEVLSVIAQQIIQIQNAIKAKLKSFTFDEEPDVKLIPTCTVNITMNPGYAGRATLPDNLKALFRPCAMMVPNYAQISQIYLYSVGFQQATRLSVKIVASLNLSSELLSSQYHYDFGMRAIKAILVDAGNKKRIMADENEDIVCLTALKAVNLPKFTIDDIPLFLSIMSDLFPESEMPETKYGDLIPALNQACEESLIQATPNFINKCLQLFDTASVRHGLMLVGETFSGKSKVILILKKAMNILSKVGKSAPARCYELNPKAISSYQLYGLFDPDTKAWSDGVLPIRMRECAADDKNPEKKWVIFDGPVDTIWIENMNTVLDDNKKLCLTSGEVIKLSNQMTMMFEVEDLVYASPATISRCGMVFLEAKQLGWQPLIHSFVIQKMYPLSLNNHKTFFQNTCIWFIDPAIQFARQFCTFPMQISWNSTVETFLENVAVFLEPFLEEENKVPKDIEDYLLNFIVFGLIWSIGAIIEEKGRPKFHKFLLEILEGKDVVEQYKLLLSYHEGESEEQKWLPQECRVSIKSSNNIYEMCYQAKNNNWVHWMQTVPNYVIPKENAYNQLLIPTSDSVRMNYFLHMNVSRMRHVLFTGPTGTGKTANVVKELNDFYFNTECTNLITAFSGQTSSNQVQKTIESKTARKRKGVLGPEERKKMLVIFIDDLNMPVKEPEGQAQPPIEVLRQWQDYGGWYDLEDKEFRRLEDIVFVGAMGPPSQGRNSITSRYSRHYNIIYVEPFEGESLSRIFENIMEWFFINQNGNLSKTVTNQKEKLVNCTVALYNRVKAIFLPTPSKQHYVYNMRDVSKVFQGISQSTFKSLRNEDELIRLWSHECMRVFQDRLVNKEDQDLFDVEIKIIIKDTFGKQWTDLVKQEPLLWASFVPCIYPGDDKTKRPLQDLYCELTDLDKVRKETYDKLEEYNNFNPSKKMNLVLFMNAIQHVIRIVRIITTTFGHALLVGVGGSGRKSLATLSCFVATFDLVQVDAKLWEDELMRVLKIAGVEMKSTVFLFSDAQVWKESQLEDICNILNNGEVPNLFPVEERNKIIEEMAQYTSGTINQKWGYFVGKCKENLHMVLCMSPEGEAFRKRILTFPGLVNCTTIDWFLPWPEDALRSTAASAIGKIKQIPDEEKDGVVDVCADMQNRIFRMSQRMIVELKRFFFVTPTSYLELLSTISKLIQERSDNIHLIINKYENGLLKLAETEKDVSAKQIYLNELTPQLQIQTVKNNEMLVVLTQKQKVADEKKEVCEKDEKETNIIRQEAQLMSDNCQADLDRVMPLLEEASKALENLSQDDINTIKSYSKPPENMGKVLEGICIALGHEKNVKWEPKEKGSFEKVQNFWAYSKKVILNSKLIKNIMEFTPERILQMPASDIKRLQKLLEEPLLEPKALKQASTNGYNLCKWIRAVVETNNALLVVEPKKKELAIAQEKLQNAEQLLAEKKAQLKEVVDILQELQDSYDKAKREKDELEAKVVKCEVELMRAQQLISGLGGEKENWFKNAQQLKEETKNIVGDVVLSSGIIAYLGAFPIHYRQEAIEKWITLLQKNKILVSEGYSLQGVMTDLITIGRWVNNDKLPNDNFSIDNSIILKNSRRWPLMIDPQLQANIWVKQMEKENQLVVIRPNENANQLQLKIDNAKQCEWPLLLENVGDHIDQIFDQVLNNIDKKTSFRFYMTTKLANPKYSPEACVQVTLLNFMATQQGLEDQLLGTLVRIEEHNKYTQREQSIKDFFENKRRQKANEDLILKLLYESSGNILENETLIDTLQQSQKDSIEIEKKLKLQEDDKVKFQNLRNGYKNAAIRGSHLYFVISNLADVEPVYQFSLESYMAMFERGISKSDKDKNKETRVNNIVERFTHILYETVVRSLLEKDKLLFSYLMTTKLMMEERKMIDSKEVMFFAVGGTALKSEQEKPEGDWSSDRQWAVLCQVADTFDIFRQIPKHMLANPTQWKSLVESVNVHMEEEVDWPKDYQHLNRFQKLIIIRILRPEKVIPAIQQLVIKELGEKFVEIPPFDLETTYLDSTCKTPLIFILSSGADPRGELENLAQKMGMRQDLITMSLGQGQGDIAENRIRDAWETGKWILLQNCHLMPSWMTKLEFLYETTPNECHPNFRLWLTTVPSPVFPVSVLQNGLKITYEPPKGLKNNLQRCYLQVDGKQFENSIKPEEWKKLLFGLIFFHALVLERRKFGPLGWNIPYEFAATDLEISISQLYMFLEEYEEVPWTALNYMVAEANYGGRVTDDRDRRLISTILSDFYSPNIIKDAYRFSPSGVYFAPESGPIDTYFEYIKNLPLNDLPEAFGMHPNAEISGAIFDTNNLCQTIISILPKEGGGGGQSFEEIVIEKCKNSLEKLPQLFDVEKCCRMRPVLFEESMNTVLQQEILRFNRLLSVVRSSLTNVIKAIDGTVSMNNDLNEVFNKVVTNKIPNVWQKFSYPSLKPLASYIIDFIDRLNFIQKWINEGSPSAFWISGFFFTQSFLTGTKQNYARKYKIPIDSLVFDFKTIEDDSKTVDVSKQPEDGIYIYGLYLDGARWNPDEQSVDEQLPNQLYCYMPHIHLIPIENTKFVQAQERYHCPVYRTSERQGTLSTTGHSTNFVLYILLPILNDTHNSAHWVKRGVALLTQLDD